MSCDMNGRQIPGIEKFGDIVDLQNPYPLTFLDQYSLAELSAELAISSFNGQLLLQACAAAHNFTMLAFVRACVALQAQYMYETFGKFPATVPSVFILMYLQVHHLDLDFYDKKFAPGAYLRTHKEHLARWHAKGGDLG